MENVVDVLRTRAQKEPDRPFLKCGSAWLSAAEMDAVSARVASGLAALGVKRGDRVALIMPNRQEMLELYFGLARLGAVQVPLNYYLKGEFLRYQLADSGANVLIADASGLKAALPLLSDTSVQHVVRLDDGSDGVPYDELRAHEANVADAQVAPSDLQSILYTSGTSGPPKGCMLPYGYYPAAGRALSEAGLVVEGDRVYTAFPLFHAGGQAISLMATLMSGGSACYATEFSASQFMRQAADVEATMVWGVGPMGMAILAQPPSDEDREHRIRLASWVPMPPAKQEEFEARFGVKVSSEMYGQTECQPATVSRVDGPRNRASAGKPAPHLEVILVDDADRPVPAGEIGEIVVRPKQPSTLFLGYWNRPQDTLDARTNLWHHTGDYGRADDDGFISFVDRKKDALRRRGENVSSFELEAAIRAHASVTEVAVCAVASPLGEDDIKACIVCGDGDAPTAEALFEFFKERLPYFAIPRYVEVRDSLPLTAATGRVQKHVLRDEGVTENCWDLEELGLVVAKADRR